MRIKYNAMSNTVSQLPVYISSSVCASILTHPLDVIKVKLQTNANQSIAPTRLLSNIYKQNGISFLFKGLRASLLRNGSFVTTKMFAYDYLRSMYPSSSFKDKIVCGMSAGLIGSLVGTPFDLIMVRIQNNPTLYPNISSTVVKTFNEEGLRAFWNGSHYTVSRAIIVTTCQFAVYEEMKERLRKQHNWDNEYMVFATSSISSSIVTSVLSNPVDVCKTRIMAGAPQQNLLSLISTEGVGAMYKGLYMNLCRQVPLNLIRFGFLGTFKQLSTYFNR